MSRLRRDDAFEVLGSDLELASLSLVTDANRHDLAPVGAKRAAILDDDAAPLASRQAQDDLVTHLQCLTS
jgi:hypothetical protein